MEDILKPRYMKSVLDKHLKFLKSKDRNVDKEV